MRFPEFKDEWIEVSLDKIVSRVTRKNKDNETDIPLTISAQNGLVDQRDFFNKVVASDNLTNYFLLKNGEFAYNKSYSAGYPWGAIKRLDKYEQGALSSLYICFAANQNVNSDYLVQYFETSKWYKVVSDIAGEGARNHGLLNVSVTEFFKTKHIVASNCNEQQKIAKFLSLLDKRIELQKSAIEKLKSL
ncbi:MAG: restriction endonuclease subunit S, partial [Paludibacteraceae bacterium]|nr:restriction endonuclease subunit S [Paludibacteraceae bacterium]